MFVSGLQRTVDRAQCQLMEERKGTGMVGSCDLCNMQQMTDLRTELKIMVGVWLYCTCLPVLLGLAWVLLSCVLLTIISGLVDTA